MTTATEFRAYPVESYDACRGDDPCAHCKASRPAAPDWIMRVSSPTQSAWELDDEVRLALPPAFHLPHFIDTCTPAGWFCASCWGDGWMAGWPCDVALRHPKHIGPLVPQRTSN